MYSRRNHTHLHGWSHLIRITDPAGSLCPCSFCFREDERAFAVLTSDSGREVSGTAVLTCECRRTFARSAAAESLSIGGSIPRPVSVTGRVDLRCRAVEARSDGEAVHGKGRGRAACRHQTEAPSMLVSHRAGPIPNHSGRWLCRPQVSRRSGSARPSDPGSRDRPRNRRIDSLPIQQTDSISAQFERID
jgi:hypothetical protein